MFETKLFMLGLLHLQCDKKCDNISYSMGVGGVGGGGGVTAYPAFIFTWMPSN